VIIYVVGSADVVEPVVLVLAYAIVRVQMDVVQLELVNVTMGNN
jgi:hypothetical protein